MGHAYYPETFFSLTMKKNCQQHGQSALLAGNAAIPLLLRFLDL